MGKKKAFSKGSNKTTMKKSPFAVNDTQHKKKPKAVKTKLKKVKERERSVTSIYFILCNFF